MELEVFVAAISFLSGLGAGLAYRRPARIEFVERVVERIVSPPVLPRHASPGRQTVVFRHANGAEEHKTLFKHSIESAMLWRDKLFAYEPDTVDPMIYNEVVF